MKSNDSQNDCPLFSRCSIGKNKWFWVTYPSFEAICRIPIDEAVDDSGYTASAGEAEEQARAAIHSKYGQVAVSQYPTIYASRVHHRKAIRRRAARKGSATDTKEIEYLYTDWESDFDGHQSSSKHRIIKKTAKRVYVAQHSIGSCNEDDKWEENGQTFHDIKTIALDRHQLETQGYASSRRHYSFFYTTPCEERRKPSKPKCFEILGLEVGATAEAVGAAYRTLAKNLHPDHGGTAEDFKKLQQAYEMALSRLSS